MVSPIKRMTRRLGCNMLGCVAKLSQWEWRQGTPPTVTFCCGIYSTFEMRKRAPAALRLGTLALFIATTLQAAGQKPSKAEDTARTPSQRYAHTNRLIHEHSSYLLLHAHNPVDWYPWGEEAFAKARRENKPIFLSVGYYTCHWCHVMERESYSNPQIAELLNRWFVAVKVDREERPDIDSEYMAYVESTTG